MQNVLFGAMLEMRSTHLARRRIGPQTASVRRSVLRPSFFGRIRSFKSSSQNTRSASECASGPSVCGATPDRREGTGQSLDVDAVGPDQQPVPYRSKQYDLKLPTRAALDENKPASGAGPRSLWPCCSSFGLAT